MLTNCESSCVPIARRVSLARIAAECGLSVSGVSRALRADERIPPATRARVRQAAARLGYRPDPSVSEAFRRVGRTRRGRFIEPLAYISLLDAPTAVAGTPYIRELFASARAQAELLGYSLEEYWARAPGMTMGRLAGILRARGVRGCLFSPGSSDVVDPPFPWERFSCVALTYSLRRPVLHRAVPFNYHNLRVAVEKACERGYRRLGLLLERQTNARTTFAYQAGFLVEAALRRPGVRFAPVLELASLDDCGRALPWIRRHRLDLVISSHAEVLTRLEQAHLALPDDLGFIGLGSGRSDPRVSSIDQRPAEVGRAGLDLLRAMLDSGLTGIPVNPRTLLVPGTWCEGSTAPPRAAQH